MLNKKTINKSISAIINSKYTYLALIILVIVQFAMIAVMYTRVSAIYAIPETDVGQIKSTIDKVSSIQNLQNEKINNIQSLLGQIQSQLYRQ